MCLAIPYKVLGVKGGGRVEIEVGGVRQEISTLLVPDVEADDWVLVNLGCVVARIEEEEAQEIMHLYQEMAEAEMPGYQG